jgi:hypothetical protein
MFGQEWNWSCETRERVHFLYKPQAILGQTLTTLYLLFFSYNGHIYHFYYELFMHTVFIFTYLIIFPIGQLFF